MYVRPSHEPRSIEDVLEVITANMFATMISGANAIAAYIRRYNEGL